MSESPELPLQQDSVTSPARKTVARKTATKKTAVKKTAVKKTAVTAAASADSEAEKPVAKIAAPKRAVRKAAAKNREIEVVAGEPVNSPAPMEAPGEVAEEKTPARKVAAKKGVTKRVARQAKDDEAAAPAVADEGGASAELPAVSTAPEVALPGSAAEPKAAQEAESEEVAAPARKRAAAKVPARKTAAKKAASRKRARVDTEIRSGSPSSIDETAALASSSSAAIATALESSSDPAQLPVSEPTAADAVAPAKKTRGRRPAAKVAAAQSESASAPSDGVEGGSKSATASASGKSAGDAAVEIPPIRRVVRRVVREVGSDRYQVMGESGPIREGVAPRPSAVLEAARQNANFEARGEDREDRARGRGREERRNEGRIGDSRIGDGRPGQDRPTEPGEASEGRRERVARVPRGRRGREFEGADGPETGRFERGEEDDRYEEEELGPPQDANGYLEIYPKGYGFLRSKERHFEPTKGDAFLPAGLIRAFGLRPGHFVEGVTRLARRGPLMVEVKSVNGEDPEVYRNLPVFEELTATFPNQRLRLETTKDRLTTRVIDMFSPIGRGQRGLIVAPPRSGKTTVLQHIAEAISENHEDEMHLMLLLVDERPEEVTELSRALPQAEVYASSNDSPPRQHLVMAEACIERAKRLVERGKHVFILMDSITRLARAYNNATQGKGRTGSGGLDIRALEIPRKIFAAARNTREAGSLTIVATALVFTGSRMDEVIFQEFKGTGNMELVLDRRIAEKYVYPAADIFKSGTRKEELLLPGIQLPKIHFLRRGLAGMWPDQAMERLVQVMKRIPNNAQLLLDIKDPR